MFSIEIVCGNCRWRTVSGRDDAVARLRLVGLLRRDPDPGDELLRTLMLDAAPRMTCPICKEKRLKARPYDDADSPGDSDWQSAVLCEVCHTPISPERLEALPETKRCVACQGRAETNIAAEDEIEYCPHCGSLVELRVSGGSGITRYRRFCTGNPPCRL